MLHRLSNLALHAFLDADWIGNKDNYTSIGAYLVYLGRNPISWSSKKQCTIARSSIEAKYLLVVLTAVELRWICLLLTNLELLFLNNLWFTMTGWCQQPMFKSCFSFTCESCCILDYHFIREHVQNGLLRVAHVSFADQLADALTKPLPCQQFQFLKTKIGLLSRPSILREAW